jgi:phytoene dehydrogenase-like protein
MQVYKKYQPDIWTEEMLDMDLFDLMDEHLESEPWKVQQAVIAWYSGAAGHWKGVAVPAWACAITLLITGRMIPPRGGMHDYFHCVMRCAIAHGATIRTCCPVDEIIINDGVAVGVRLRETATQAGKKIWANKAVISDVDVRQTFNKLVGPSHVDRGLLQKVNDISLKGGSIFNFHFYTRERLKARKPWAGKFMGGGYPQDSREIYYDHVADVDGWRGNPRVPPERAIWLSTPYERFEPTDKQVTRPEGHIMSPVYFLVPPPEYHVDGPDAINRIKDQMVQYIIKAMSSGPYENLNSDNIIKMWTNTPYDSLFRNTGLIGGTWCGTRHCHDQWAENRPVPELARYRTPIDGLYLCNQTSSHPGGLHLMAIPYNLMHILIEDGLVEPGPWWYSAPYYIPQDGKKSAKRPS